MVGLLAFAVRCSSSSNGGGDAFSNSANPTSSGGSGGGSFGGGYSSSGGAADAGLPAETKAEDNYKSPVATGNLVWIANPTSGLVAYIDAATFTVQTVQAGNGPTYLAAVPDTTDDVAIVLNVLSQDATLLRNHAGMLSATTFPSTADANSWAISNSGRWALAWTNAAFVSNADPTEGFQDVAVLDLHGMVQPITLSVGYRPSQFAFSSDESKAFAVTQDGISVIDLVDGTQPTVTANYALSASGGQAMPDAGAPDGSGEASMTDGPSSAEASTGDGSTEDVATVPPVPLDDGGPPTSTPDVSFTPDGAYALVRSDGVAAITVVSLKDGTSVAVPLPSAPTDLDLSPDGTFALAVLRDSSQVVTLPIPGVFTAPMSFTTTTIAGELIGRAIVTAKQSSGQQLALLFTTVAPVDRLTVMTLGPSPSYRVVQLHDPVYAVFPTPDAQNAVVLHNVTPDPASGIEGAFSIVPIAVDLPTKIVGVPAPPTAVALSPTSDRALVTVKDTNTGTFGLYMGLMPSLQVLQYPLASPPIAVGIVAGADRGYVAQDYTEGRITFVDLGSPGCDAGTACTQARTITGFDLSARVVTGGTQP
jgi:hypothetical protein